MTATLLNSALQYAGRGWHILPLHHIKSDGACSCSKGATCGKSAGKHPALARTGTNHSVASIDPAQIQKWWKQYPNANIGIVTGERSGLLIVDVDGDEGVNTLIDLVEMHSYLPPTLGARSGRVAGGRHLYYRWTGTCGNSAGDGLDFRGDGGLIVAPPSMHASGRPYAWIEPQVPLTPMPDWLLAWFRDRTGARQKQVPDNMGLGPKPAHLAAVIGDLAERALASIRTTAPLEDVIAACEHLSSVGLGWEAWNNRGLALYAANPEAREAFHILSRKSPKYDAAETNRRWEHFARCPPSRVSFGSIVFKVRETVPGWIPPSQQPVTAPPNPMELPKDTGTMNGHHALPPAFTEEKSLNPLIKLNNKHYVIGDLGGKCMIMSLVPSKVDPTVKTPSFQSFKSFSERYANQYVVVKSREDDGSITEETKQLGAYWLKWTGRKSYEGLDLAPGRDLPADILNLWSGFAVEPAAGGWPRMRQHIVEVLAAGDRPSAEYIVRFAAWAVQNPGERAEAALVFRGGKGTGKGSFANALKHLFGQHGLQIFNSKHLVGAFNGHLRNCLLLFADEAFWAGDKQGESVLKGLITEPALMIEQKGVDAAPWKNRLHVIMSANADWVVPASHDERRYAVFDVASHRQWDKAYFRALHDELAAGGLAAMLHDLLALKLGDWHPREIVATDALARQKERSMPPLWEWWAGLLDDGLLPHHIPNKPDTSAALDLLEHARHSTPKLRDLSATALGRFLREQGADRFHTETGNLWRLPSLDTARESFRQRYTSLNWANDFSAWRGKVTNRP